MGWKKDKEGKGGRAECLEGHREGADARAGCRASRGGRTEVSEGGGGGYRQGRGGCSWL